MRGTMAIPEASHELPETSRAELDADVEALSAAKARWASTPIFERTALLNSARRTTAAVAERWVEAAVRHKGLTMDSPFAGEEWQSGPALLLRNLRILADTLGSLEETGEVKIPGKVKMRPDGITTAGVFPTDSWDRLLFPGIRADVWMEPGVNPNNLREHMASAYKPGAPRDGAVVVVLGAGNIASIPAMDALYKLVAENSVVLLKMNPVNEYLGPIFEEALAAFVDAGYLRIVYGGVDVGAYLVDHDSVDAVHITGSDKAHDAIVFGEDEDRSRRKAENHSVLDKPISSELGNVTPVIVVPGPWSAADLEFQGENLASGLTHNAGFNCVANRVLVTHRQWEQRDALLGFVRTALRRIPSRAAYYPGAVDRWQKYVEAFPGAEQYGRPSAGEVPWTFIPGLDPADDHELCFQAECFTGVFSETPIGADSTVEYLETAVEFCNDRLWGSLGATLIVHPDSMKDRAVKAAVDKAIADLRYGSISVNIWVAVAYAAVTTSWGAHPGHGFQDIQSGRGVVHNALLFDRPLKSVCYAPFRQFPKPAWFGTNRTSHKTLRALTYFEADPSFAGLAKVLGPALRG